MITITAPKKGLGQTVTAINIATMIGEVLKNKVLLVDLNQYCYGVEEYLSNTSYTKGMDEFKNDLVAGLTKHEGNLQRWSKEVTSKLDIMASNRYFQVNDQDISNLKLIIENRYSAMLVDSIAGDHYLTKCLINQSKVLVVVLGQDRSILPLIESKKIYLQNKEKIIFVINRYLSTYEGLKVKYGVKEITGNLHEMGYKNDIYTLPFDINLINECNDQTLLNYSLSLDPTPSQYHVELRKLTLRILELYCGFQSEKEFLIEKKKRNFFNFFNF